MIFCSASGSAVGAAALGSAVGVSGLGAGGGATGAGNGPGVLRREIGGRTAARFPAPSPSARFGFGFFSSISETVSTGLEPAGFGFGGSTGFAAVSTRALTGSAGAFGFSGACATVVLEIFAGACVFALFVSLAGSFVFCSV